MVPSEKSLGVNMITVMLADQLEIVRCGLRAVLAAQPDIKLVGEYGRSDELVEAIAHEPPAVLVMGLAVDGSSVFDVLAELQNAEWPTKILIFSEDNDRELARRAFDLGADGYALHSSSMEAIAIAVRAVNAGACWVDARLKDGVIAKPTRPAAAQEVTTPPKGPPLSQRETEILTLVATGMSNSEIARALGIGPETVKSHIRNIMQKLAAKDRTQAAIIAYQLGSIPA